MALYEEFEKFEEFEGDEVIKVYVDPISVVQFDKHGIMLSLIVGENYADE